MVENWNRGCESIKRKDKSKLDINNNQHKMPENQNKQK